ncbi:FAD-dependent oxidoreductase [Geminicoccus roseus]|uniref:FAD-dependent oxidoreductase n=1 Tax=Geminicoccus roseus TaxID=404900 RepID=UPI0003FD9E9B|nr:cyclic nucleotide-binding domain-containing thioredoxin-disulfide reductase [Geminicoccus roseus]
MTEPTAAAPLGNDPGDPTDPYLRPDQTFPRLLPEMAARIAAYGSEEAVPAGTLLYRRGERGVDFFLVLEGEVEVFEEHPQSGRHVFATHSARQFTGEMNLLNDREILVSCQAAVESRVVRIGQPSFRRLLAAEADIAEIVMRAFILRRVGFIRHGLGGVILLGGSHDGGTLRLQRFLVRNGYPHRPVAAERDTETTAGLMREFGLAPADLPAVIAPGRLVLRNPSTYEMARQLGLTERIDAAEPFDLAVVGAGPGGLAAAVYAASEGLSTIVVEQEAPGGQAGTTTRIENYLGFPTGISGAALAGRAQAQAQKFGAHLALARASRALHCASLPYRIDLQDGSSVQARAVVVATGARYRKLDLPDYDRFEGQGIHYAATAMEARLCEAEEVAVVGGGNSAGQAAVFLARTAAHVHVLVRGPGLAATMSDYLVRRIETSPKITVHPFTEVVALAGDTLLRRVTWQDRQSGQQETREVGSLFVMIGAMPNTEWLGDCLPLDAKGFVLTGQDRDGLALPSPYATTTPGVFAVGDVRSGSVKRVASAVGEGSVVVQAIHRFLHPGSA